MATMKHIFQFILRTIKKGITGVRYLLKFLFKLVFYWLACSTILYIISTWIYPEKKESFSCYNNWGIWDERFSICRYDCNIFEEGCQMVSDEEVLDRVYTFCFQGDTRSMSSKKCQGAGLELARRLDWKEHKEQTEKQGRAE